MQDPNNTPFAVSPFAGPGGLVSIAFALRALCQTLDFEGGVPFETDLERDRLHGLAIGAHLLSARLVEICEPLAELGQRHYAELARIAADAEAPIGEVIGDLLSIKLDDVIARREADEAADARRPTAAELNAMQFGEGAA
jgi:hypothetical protein